MAVFWCKHSNRSTYVCDEYSKAIKYGKDVMPVLLDSTPIAKPLRVYEWVDFRVLAVAEHSGWGEPDISELMPSIESNSLPSFKWRPGHGDDHGPVLSPRIERTESSIAHAYVAFQLMSAIEERTSSQPPPLASTPQFGRLQTEDSPSTTRGFRISSRGYIRGRIRVVYVESMDQIMPAIKSLRAGRYDIDQIEREPLLSGRYTRRWGVATKRPNGRVVVEPDPWDA